MTLTFGSLFSGVGGFDLGFECAGMVCSWQVEIDAAATSVLSRHWPDVPKYADVRDVGAHNLAPVDVICFGSPCQDLSVAGNRAGMAGARSGLFYEAVRIIRELRPAFAIWENVPGALSSAQGRDFGAAIDALADAGAVDICWRVLDARWFGVAQRRRRVFLVADFRGERAGKVLFESESLPGHSQTRRAAGQESTYTTAPSLTASGRGVERAGESRGQDPLVPVVPTLARCEATGEGARLDGETCTFVPIAFDWQAGHGNDDSFRGKSRQYIVRKGEYTGSLQENKRDAVLAFTSKDYGGDAGELLPTLRSLNFDKSHMNGGGQVAVAGPMAVRRLTPTECERLQSFPDGWTAGQADSSRYRQLGNAVCVNVAEWIGRRIVEATQ